ncbi:MAG: putative hydrophobe/Amphiphile Efflux-3 (HAE3) family protein [Haloquadratum sp. J07HQX50]|nr:MAG: putative hydrophobe/Amphiphile Efflux-3 (HAE3) family protein [Haloquadratum sp. J07HQX50]
MKRSRQFFARIGRIIQAHPVATILLAIALIGVAFVGASQIVSVTGNSAFVGSNPTLDTFQESFDRDSLATLVRGEVSHPATMAAIDRFDRRMEEVENVDTVQSPADQVRAEYGRIPDSQAKIERVIGSPDQTIISISSTTDISQPESRPIYEEAVSEKEWAQFPAGVEVTVTGSAAFSAQLNELIGQSTQQLLGLAVGLMTVALFFIFRGVRLRLLPIVAVFVGVIYTFGAIGYAGVPNSTLTSAVFPILIGLGIDYSVQFHERYEEELESYPPKKALPLALGGIGPPVSIAALSAALGFGATWVSSTDTPAFVWFAQTSMFGIGLTFLSAIILLLPVLTLYARWRQGKEPFSLRDTLFGDDTDSTESDVTTAADGGKRQQSGPRRDDDTGASSEDEEIGKMGYILGKTTRFVAANPVLVLLVAILLLGGGLEVGSDLETLADTEEFFPQDLPAYVDLQQFRTVTGGGSSVQYDMLVSGSNLRDPETLQWMETTRQIAEDKPLVEGLQTPATLIKQYNGGEIPETRTGVNAVLERVPESQKQNYYNNGQAHITVIGERNMNTDELLDMLTIMESVTEFSQPPAGVDAQMTGSAAVSTPSIVEQINSRNTTTGLGLLAVFSALLLYYRDLVRAIAPLVPMVFVIGWQNLYMAALNIPVSSLGASLGAMSVGIGAEYTIIVMERYYEEVGQSGVSRLEAVEIAGSRVGKAITVSGLTTVFGFSALTLSPFPILSDFGFLTVGVIALTLVAAIMTLPPTLVLLGRLEDIISGYLKSSEKMPAGRSKADD